MTTSLTSLSLPAVVSQLRVLLPTDKHAALDSVLNEHSETGGVSVRVLSFLEIWKPLDCLSWFSDNTARLTLHYSISLFSWLPDRARRSRSACARWLVRM